MDILTTPVEVAERIEGDEDSQTEFKGYRLDGKSVVSEDGKPANTESFAGEMVAFANEAGGVIILGVNDDKRYTGYSQDDLGAVVDWAINIARNNVVPPVNPVVRTFRMDGAEGTAWVAALHIQPGLVHRTSGGRWYRRIGRDKRDVDLNEMERLIHDRGTRFSYDERPVPTSRTDDLDLDRIERIFGQASDISTVQLLRNRKIVAGPDDRPTIAGLLVFGRQPSDHLPEAVIRMAVYRGADMNADLIVHEADLGGPLNEQIDAATALVNRFMQHAAVKEQGREERPQFDLDAVMEAVVNACVHRDYAVVGSRIRLFMFDDRLEVRSPGGLPNTLDLQSMRYRQYTRNQLLVNLLAKASTPSGRRYIEERGEGIERIIRRTLEVAGAEPEFSLDGRELRVSIPGRVFP